MLDDEKIDVIRAARQAWEATLGDGRAAHGGGAPVQADPALDTQPLYTPTDLEDEGFDYVRDVGRPGEYPFTRGIHPSMYRSRSVHHAAVRGLRPGGGDQPRGSATCSSAGWPGSTSPSTCPPSTAYDSDDPRARGEVGKVGVPVNSLRDLETLFDGIPLEPASPANAINAPAAVILAMYVALAEQQGVPLERLGGSTQNDILKEFIARGTYIFPPGPVAPAGDRRDRVLRPTGCRAGTSSTSAATTCARPASTLVQEVGFALADAITYVEAAIDRGLAIDDFAPRFAFNFTAGTDLFGEAAKFRAMRRMWARLMRERFGATKPASWVFRTGAGSGASQLTAQQPENNIVRVTLQRPRRDPRRRPVAPHRGLRRGAGPAHRGVGEAGAPRPSRCWPTRPASTEVVDPLAGLVLRGDADRPRSRRGARQLIAEIEGGAAW